MVSYAVKAEEMKKEGSAETLAITQRYKLK
jgi:hypothetical protein